MSSDRLPVAVQVGINNDVIKLCKNEVIEETCVNKIDPAPSCRVKMVSQSSPEQYLSHSLEDNLSASSCNDPPVKYSNSSIHFHFILYDLIH